MGELRGTVAGRFQIDQLAGSGGHGAVYRAWDGATGSVVALKVLHADTSAMGARFGREAAVLEQLSHPNIVRFVAHGRTERGEAFLAMEWLEGEDLSELLERRLLASDEAVRLGVLVAEALGVAHAAGIVHRDLKPQNLFLVDGHVDRVKVVDFGIARDASQQGERLTRTGVILGTPAYMAPEQVRAAKSVGPAADVWALGALLFQSLTGRYLFAGTTPMEMVLSALSKEPPRLATVLPSVDSALDAALATLLVRDSEQRPADGAAAAALLREVGAGSVPLPPTPAPAAAALSHRCLVIVRPPQADDPSAPLLDDVRALVERHGAELLLLADGTAAAVVERTLPLAEQVAAALPCAVSLRKLAPSAGVAVVADQAADGKTQVAAHSAAELLAGAQAPHILVNPTAAQHVGAPFGVHWQGDRAYLVSPEASAATFATPSSGQAAFVDGVVGGSLPPVPPAAGRAATGGGPAAAHQTFAAATSPAGPAAQAGVGRGPGLYVALGAAGAFLLALLVVGAGWAYWAWSDDDGVVFEADDDDSDEDDLGPCTGHRCLDFGPRSPRTFDPGAEASSVIEAVHGPYPKAQLTMISVPQVSVGTVDLANTGAAQYIFHLPQQTDRPTLSVLPQPRRLILLRTSMPSPFGPQPVGPPRCSLARAWAVARKQGLGKSEEVTVSYRRCNHPMTGKDLGPAWEMMSTGDGTQMWWVDGSSCALLASFDPESFMP